MRNRSHGYRSDNELTGVSSDQGALWIASHPLVTGFLEAKKAYDDGTAETRSILVRECSLIYECNVCRNMFRSLTNFVKHKRIYCCKSFDHMNNSRGNGLQDVIVKQRKQCDVAEESANWSDLILKMLTGEHNKVVGDACSNEEPSQTATQSDLKEDEPDNATTAMNASRDNPEDNACIETPLNKSTVTSNSSYIENTCDKCERTFNTSKSFKIHIQKKHRTLKCDFQCPSCSLTFPQPAAVVQHHSCEHKKSIRRIKVTRDAIQKLPVHEAEFPNKTIANEDTDSECSETKTSACLYCKKTFLRKAVLLTHEQSCKLKQLYQSEVSFFPETKNEATSDTTQTSTTSLNESNEFTTDQSFEDQVKFPNDAVEIEMLKPHIEESLNLKITKQKLKSKYLPCLCKICNKHFSALSNLRRHISMIHYRTRKFGCKLCEYRAYRKYDVINHLGHIHKILGDKETMNSDYIDEHAEQSTREFLDEDVIIVTNVENVESMENIKTICNNEQTSVENEAPPALNFKNKGYKPFLLSARIQKSVPRDRQKLKRSISQQFESTTLEAHHKRPKRKRITPVEKDFVYDLSAILKNDANATEREAGRILKKRDTLSLTAGDQHTALNENVKNKNEEKQCKPLINCSADSIKGTAQKTAVFCVHQGRAAYSSLPQLPTERPQVRMRHATIYRADFAAVPVIEATDLVEARLKSKLLNDSFLENFTATATDEFKMKPRLALPQSTINSLLKKVDLTMQNNIKIKTEVTDTVPTMPVKQEITMESSDRNYFHLQNVGVKQTYSQLVCMHQHEAMRECLLGDEPKQSDSLLRCALEN